MTFFTKKKKSEESQRTTATGECARILDEAFSAVDRTLAEKRAAKEAAKKLQETVAKCGERLRIKHA